MSSEPVTLTLEKTGFDAGVWTGRLTAPGSPNGPPELHLSQDGQPLAPPDITAVAGTPNAWNVRFEIPVTALGDGVSVFVISDAQSGAPLLSIPFLAGEALADDLRGEVATLRAELDQLRAAFQTAMRACDEGRFD